MQINLKLISACFFLLVGAIASSATALPEVKYGSGTEHVARNFGNCNLEPGAVCGGLAALCAESLRDSDASLVWQIVACACAGLWCGAQATLNLLCCLGKLNGCVNGNFVAPKNIDVPQRVIDNIATFADKFGNTFSNDDLLHAIQGNGGGSLQNNPQDRAIIDEIMRRVTGNAHGMANRGQVNNYLRGTSFGPGWQH